MVYSNGDIMELKDKVVFITGATGGMGKELARQFAKEQCKLALFARREEKLKAICKELNTVTKCVYKTCDVTKTKDIAEAVQFTKKTYGCIDIALLTARVLVPNPIETFSADQIKQSIDINFIGDLYFIDHLFQVMKKQKSGTIAAVSTLPDKRGVPGWGAYGASKAALSWMLESLRAEAKQKYNINMITIKPGSVETPMIKDFPRRGAIHPKQAASLIIQGVKKEKKIIQFPLMQVLLVRMSDLFPNFVYDSIPLDLQKGDGYPEVKEK